MKKWIGAIVFAIVCMIGVQSSDAIVRVVGSQAECDTAFSGCFAIPLRVTALCTASCVQNIAQDFVVPTRIWGTSVNSCRVSVNGGVTWANCGTVNPTGSGGQTYIAGTADGAAVVIGDNGANNCIVKRSTDGGTVWTTVYTNTGIGSSSCTSGTQGNSRLQCKIDGTCLYIGRRVTDGRPISIYSSDSGASWSLGAGTGNTVAGEYWSTWEGSFALGPPTTFSQRSIIVSSLATPSTSAATWNRGCTTGFGGATGVCWIAATNTAEFRNNEGTVLSTNTFPGALITGVPMSLQYGSSVYVISPLTTPGSTIGIWVIPNTGGTGTLIYTSPNVNSMISPIGDLYLGPGGCIYFAAGTTNMVGKICI